MGNERPVGEPMKKKRKSSSANIGKQPQDRIFLAEDWWGRLVNYCQEKKLALTEDDIYVKTNVSRRTYGYAKESNSFTTSTFDIIVKYLGCKNRDELVLILGGKPKQDAEDDQPEAFIQKTAKKSVYYDSKYWLALLKKESPGVIKGILLQALSHRYNADPNRVISAISDPICIKEYAEHLVGSSRDEVDNFYGNRLGEIPQEIKSSVSLYISANTNLTDKFVDNILESPYGGMFNWFQLAANYFPESFALNFDWAFLTPRHLELLKNHLREDKFVLLECLATLIIHFRDHRCQNAERKLLEMCLENDYAVIRTALKRNDGSSELTAFLKRLNGVLSKMEIKSLKGLLSGV